MFKIKRANLIILLILIVALPVSLYLARHPQILRGRATGNPPMEFFQVGPGNVNLDTDAAGIPVTTDSNVKLRLTYSLQAGLPAQASNPTPTLGVVAQSTTDQCSPVNLRDGQTISGDTPVVFIAVRSSPSYYLSLNVTNSRQESFQIISTLSNVVFASASLFQNGQATIECRIQTDPSGGTIISSNQVRVNVAN